LRPPRKPNSRFENYFAYQEPVSELRKPLASHRYLAMRRGWVEEDGELVPPSHFKSPEQGAATQVWAATSPQLAGMGGVYCADCDITEPAPADGALTGVQAYAIDPEQAARLWELSAELTGVNAFA